MASSAGTMPNTGRWGWYKDHEGREFRRVSTLIKKVDTKSDDAGNSPLGQWVRRQVLLGAAKRTDVLLGVKALGEPGVLGWTQQQKRQLNTWAEDCMTAAGSDAGRIRGTAVHDLTERLDRGEDIESVVRGLDPESDRDLRAYAKLRELNGWRSVEIERTVVCDEFDVAGSFDRIDVIPGLAKLIGPGKCQHEGHEHDEFGAVDVTGHPIDDHELSVIVDVKTEKDPLLNGLHIAPQLAIYSRAKRMWLPGTDPNMSPHVSPSYVDTPCVRQDVAIIVHVRDGKAVPYFVDLTAGWEAAQAAAQQLEREKAAKRWFAAVPGIVEPRPVEVLIESRVSRVESVLALATAMLDASKVTATALGPAPMPLMMTEAPVYSERPVEQVAERGADGMVRWSDGPVDRLLQLIRQAPDTAALGELWQSWNGAGNVWGGLIAQAADERRKQVECPQRALHMAGKCACGWREGLPS